MSIARRRFIESITGGAAAVAAMGPRLFAAPPETEPQVLGLENNALHIEIGGLAAFEWWRTDKRMTVHFPSGQTGRHPLPHRVVLTARLRNIIAEGSREPDTLIMLPGQDDPIGAWNLDGYDLRIEGAPEKGALQVADYEPELPAPSRANANKQSAWASIRWLPPFQELFGAANMRTVASGPEVASRLHLTTGAVQCLMPSETLRDMLFEFSDESDKTVAAGRALSDKVLYEYPLINKQATLVGTPIQGSRQKPFALKFKQDGVTIAIPITLMALPVGGRRAAAHFVAYRALAPNASREVKPGRMIRCAYDTTTGRCIDPKGRVPTDIDHCFIPLIAHP